jgi:hypothetical protein
MPAGFSLTEGRNAAMQMKKFSGEICFFSATEYEATKIALEAANFTVTQIPTEDPDETALFMFFERDIELELMNLVDTITKTHGGDVVECGIPRVHTPEIAIHETGEVHDLVQ